MLRKIALIYLISMIMLIWGIGIGKFQVFPHDQISAVYSELKAFKAGLDHTQNQSVSEILSNLFQEKILSAPKPQLITDYYPGQSGLMRDVTEEKSGYLLLSGLDPQENQHTVKLIDLSNNTELHKWTFDYQAVFDNTPVDAGSYKLFSRERTRTFHPLLLDDGSIIFNVQEGPLVKIDVCSAHQWTNNHHFHHSIEHAGPDTFWVNTVLFDRETGMPRVHLWDKDYRMRDDGIGLMNSNGDLIEEMSIRKILEDNGYEGLLYGTGKFLSDRLHANDVTPASRDSEYWNMGDLLISLRDISTVFLYRPSTGKILWLKTGPWLFQHDPDFVGDSKISVFGNQTIPSDGQFTGKGVSEIFVYDFETNTISTPYRDILMENDFYSRAEGVSRILPDGTLFVEETIRGRLLKVSPDKLIWTYINRYDDSNLGQVSWSRFYTEEEIAASLDSIQNTRCN